MQFHFTLKMEAACFSTTKVPICQAVWRYIQEDHLHLIDLHICMSYLYEMRLSQEVLEMSPCMFNVHLTC
jgi:hypothetical protein